MKEFTPEEFVCELLLQEQCSFRKRLPISPRQDMTTSLTEQDITHYCFE